MNWLYDFADGEFYQVEEEYSILGPIDPSFDRLKEVAAMQIAHMITELEARLNEVKKAEEDDYAY
jgi:hypothetical protein